MSDPYVIVDTDVLSIFAKVDALDVLDSYFGEGRYVITPGIQAELAVPLQYGYGFPQAILERVETTGLSDREWKTHISTVTDKRIGRGESEAIAVCVVRKWIFVTNDSQAARVAQSTGVQTVSFPALVRGIWLRGILDKSQTERLLIDIQKADRLSISPEVVAAIFAERDDE